MRTVEETRVAVETADQVLVALWSEQQEGESFAELVQRVEDERELGRASLNDALALARVEG